MGRLKQILDWDPFKGGKAKRPKGKSGKTPDRNSQVVTEALDGRKGHIVITKPTLDVVRARIDVIESILRPKVELSDKLRIQGEMTRMRAGLRKGNQYAIASYPLNPPYAFADIRFHASDNEFRYTVLEPKLAPGEQQILDDVRKKMDLTADREEVPVVVSGRLSDDPAMQAYLRRKFEFVVDLYDIHIDPKRVPVIFYYLERDLIGLGRADAILRDPFVEDVSCNGHGIPIFVFHRVYGSMRTNVTYPDELLLNKYIQKLAQVSGRHVSIYQPILDATLQDGSRINLTLGTEVTRKGSTFSIRKFAADPISPIDLISLASVGVEPMAWMWHLIQNKRSILVSGGTASGKTTMLNALSMFMRPEDKVVSIEDTAEIQLAHTNWIQSVARAGFGTGAGSGGVGTAAAGKPGSITLFDLLVAALRQRPEYVIVGEVRGREASTLFQAIATGHAALATIHAGSVEELLHRMESEPMDIPRALIQSLDAVVFPAQVIAGGGRARRLKGITEVLGIDGATNNLLTSDPYHWDPLTDTFRFLGRSFVLEKIAETTGRTLEDQQAQLEDKAKFLRLLQKRGISHFKEFTKQINSFYVDSKIATQQLESGMVA